MGLQLRFYLFHGVSSGDVRGALQEFYADRGRPLEPLDTSIADIDRDLTGRIIEIYAADNNWVVVRLDGGWEWKERLEAQLFVSRRLWCPAFLIFVYDGDYWGYELFDRGKVLDHFVQQKDQADLWFPGRDCSGNIEVVVEHLPFLRAALIGPYLMQKPTYEDPPELKGRVRPNDEFDRFDECGVLDFLRVIGIHVNLKDEFVVLASPVDYSLRLPLM
jgi:hypothetical protein